MQLFAAYAMTNNRAQLFANREASFLAERSQGER
jgi:hypothetical protein